MKLLELVWFLMLVAWQIWQSALPQPFRSLVQRRRSSGILIITWHSLCLLGLQKKNVFKNEINYIQVILEPKCILFRNTWWLHQITRAVICNYIYWYSDTTCLPVTHCFVYHDLKTHAINVLGAGHWKPKGTLQSMVLYSTLLLLAGLLLETKAEWLVILQTSAPLHLA